MAGVRLDIGGEDRARGLVEALNRKIDDLETKLKSVAKQSAVTEREGKKLWEQTRTPLEKYNIALDKSKQLLDQGKISHETYQRSVERAKRALDEQGSAGVNWAGQLLTRYGSLTAVLGGVTAAFRAVGQAQQEAAGKVQAAAPGLASLAQLAGGDINKYKALIGQARGIHRAGAAPGLNEAAGLLFTLKSAGVTPADMRFFQQAASSQAFGDVASLVKSSAALRSSLGPAAGTHQQLISAALGAAEFATTDVGSIMTGASRAGGSAAALGINEAQLLATTSVLQRGTGSAETAGTQLHALFRDVGKREGFAGLGVVGIVQRLQADQRLQKQLTDEGLAGFRRLAGNLPNVQAAIASSEKGRASNLAATTARLPAQVPEVQAAIDAQRGAAAAEGAATGLGVRALRSAAAVARVQAEIQGDSNYSALRRWAAGVAGGIAGSISSDPRTAVLGAELGAGALDIRPGIPGRRVVEILESINRNTGRGGGAVPMPEH
jgi:hypothetical protein